MANDRRNTARLVGPFDGSWDGAASRRDCRIGTGAPAMTPPATRPDAPAIDEATTPGQIAAVRALLVEYQASLGLDLEFQGFAGELATLPGDYAPPAGVLYLATVGGGRRRLHRRTADCRTAGAR